MPHAETQPPAKRARKSSRSIVGAKAGARGSQRKNKRLVYWSAAKRKAFGAELKRRRLALGLTQTQLGVALGAADKPLSLHTVWRWESGGAIEHPGLLNLALDRLESREGKTIVQRAAAT